MRIYALSIGLPKHQLPTLEGTDEMERARQSKIQPM